MKTSTTYDTARPAALIAEGQSFAFPDPGTLPDDALIFRMGSFFAESQYHYGSRVDGYIHDGSSPVLEKLADELRAGRYTCDTVLATTRLANVDEDAASAGGTSRTGGPAARTPLPAGTAFADLWGPVFDHPVLARRLAAPELAPSLPFSAIAYLAASGFTDIRLFGFDQLSRAARAQKFGTSITAQVRARLAGTDDSAGNPGAQIDRDLGFLAELLREFPDANITTASDVPLLEPLMRRTPAGSLSPGGRAESGDNPDATSPAAGNREDAEAAPSSAATAPAAGNRSDAEAAPSSAATSPAATPAPAGLPRRDVLKTHLTLGAGTLAEVSPANPTPWTTINGRRCAYVTLVSGDYHHGARALARSMAKVTDVPLIVLCAPGTDRRALEASGLNCIDVPEILTPHAPGEMQARFAATYTKLNVFRLAFLDRAVYLDSDTLMLNDADELFCREGFWAVPDAGIHLQNEGFNSGVFAFDPSTELFDALIAKIGKLPSADGGDQGFLNSFLGDDWGRLSLDYNTTKRIWLSHNPLFNLEHVKVLHYVGVKPWQIDPGHEQYSEVIDLWYDHLADFELRDLLRAWSRHPGGSSGVPGGPGKATASTVHAGTAPASHGVAPASPGTAPAATGAPAPPGRRFKDAQSAFAHGRLDEAHSIAAELARNNPAAMRPAKLLFEIEMRRRRYPAAAKTLARAARRYVGRVVGR